MPFDAGNVLNSLASYLGGVVEAIDDGFFINSIDDGFNGINQLNPDLSSVVQERGTSITIAGDTLTLVWNAPMGLATSDMNDTIISVQWSNLDELRLQQVGRPTTATSLFALLGMFSITCNN